MCNVFDRPLSTIRESICHVYHFLRAGGKSLQVAEGVERNWRSLGGSVGLDIAGIHKVVFSHVPIPKDYLIVLLGQVEIEVKNSELGDLAKCLDENLGTGRAFFEYFMLAVVLDMLIPYYDSPLDNQKAELLFIFLTTLTGTDGNKYSMPDGPSLTALLESDTVDARYVKYE